MKKLENKVYYFIVQHNKDCKPDVQTAAHTVSDTISRVRHNQSRGLDLFENPVYADFVCKDATFMEATATTFIADFTSGNLVVRYAEERPEVKVGGLFGIREEDALFIKNEVETQISSAEKEYFIVWDDYNEYFNYADFEMPI